MNAVFGIIALTYVIAMCVVLSKGFRGEWSEGKCWLVGIALFVVAMLVLLPLLASMS